MISKIKRIWDSIIKILNFSDNNFYTSLALIMIRDLAIFRDKLLAIVNQSLLLKLVYFYQKSFNY